MRLPRSQRDARSGDRLWRRLGKQLGVLLAALFLMAEAVQAIIIIIRIPIIVTVGGGGGGGGAVLTRSLASEAVNDVVVAGNYAFLANGERGFQAVDLRNPAAPVRLPPLTIGGYARDIALFGNYVYLATQESGVRVINIVQPDRPLIETTLVPTFQRTARQAHLVVVSADSLCIGTDQGELIVFAGPNFTNQAGEIAFGASGILSIVLRGHYAFVTVQNGGLQIVDLSNPSSPTVVARWPETGGTFPGLSLSGNFAFLTSAGGLQVLDISTVTQPVAVGLTSVPGQLTSVAVAGDYAYVAAGSSGLQILSITNRAAPVLIATVDTAGFALALELFGHFVVVADDLGGTTIIDVSDPANPVLVHAVDAGSPPANDAFENRLFILPGHCPIDLSSSSRYATKEKIEPNHAGQSGGRSVWWQWTAPFSGPVKISTAGSTFNTLLAVYTGASLSALTEVASNVNAGTSDSYSAVQFDAMAGTQYQIAVDGNAKDHGQVRLRLLPLTPLASLTDSLDLPQISWTTGGDRPWFGQTCVVREADHASRSGPVEASQQSWLETTAVGPGMLRFWWKVSSQENSDGLGFAVNGIEKSRISGEVEWQEARCWLGSGTNTLRWTYNKDYAVSQGQDAAWLDDVSFERASPAIPSHLGDLDRDGQATVLDLALLIDCVRDTGLLPAQVTAFADVNGNGVVNTEDITALADIILGRRFLIPAADTDGDGIPGVLEALLGLTQSKRDSLGDGIFDGDRDFDLDSLTNTRELHWGTDPLRPDSDSDGFWDGAEVEFGSNPLEASSRPFQSVFASPQVAIVLPAMGGTGGMALNTIISSPSVAFVLPAHPIAGGLANNTIVANPPVGFVLLGAQETGGMALNTIVAIPPLSLVLPSNQGGDGLGNNTIVAAPPTALVLPSNQGAGALGLNTTIARPPVRLQINSP